MEVSECISRDNNYYKKDNWKYIKMVFKGEQKASTICRVPQTAN